MSAAELSTLPILGYRLPKPQLTSAATQPDKMLQPWIAATSSTTVIDVYSFDRFRPFAQLFRQSSTSTIVPSAAATGHPEASRVHIGSKPAGTGVVVCGDDFDALAWAHGAIISAKGPTAVALYLVIGQLTPQVIYELIETYPRGVEQALDVFNPEIPFAPEYKDAAHRQIVLNNWADVKARAIKHKKQLGEAYPNSSAPQEESTARH